MNQERTKPAIKTGLFTVLMFMYLMAFNPPIRFNKIMWYGALILVTFSLLYVILARGRIKGNYMTKWVFITYSFFCVSLLWAGDKTFPNPLKYLIYIFPICLLMLYAFENLQDIEQLMRILRFAVLFTGVYVILLVDRSQLGEARIGAALEETMNSNDIGMKMCIGLPLAFYFLGRSKKLLSKLFNLSSVILFLFVIFYSGSRNALLTMLATCVCYLLVRARGLKKFWAVIGSVLLLVGVYIFIMNYPPVYNVLGIRVEAMINGLLGNSSEGSFDWRNLMVSEGLRYFRESPIVGQGIDNFRYLFGAQYGYQTYAHNNYVEILADVGLAGFLLYYSIYFYVLKGLWKYAVGQREPMAICVFVMNIAILISHLSGVLYDSWEVNTLLVFGALYISIKKGKTENEESRKILQKMD